VAARDVVSAVVVLAAGIVVAAGMNQFDALQWTEYLAFALLAVSFSYVWGKGGIFSFGQAALFGIGAYTYSVVAINVVPLTNETISAVLAAIVVAALFAGA